MEWGEGERLRAHGLRINARFSQPFFIRERRNFAGFDLASSTPEDVGVARGDSDGGKVFVDGGFVGEDFFAVGAVGDAHDVDVVELRAAFTPVAVGHDVKAADLAARIILAARGDGPMEKGVVLGNAFACGVGLYVLEEGGETSDDAPRVELGANADEFVE